MHVSVLGAGSWGTALSIILSLNGHTVTLWNIKELMQEHYEEAAKTKYTFPKLKFLKKLL